MRLNKYLAEAGVASRRKCDDLIEAGTVAVNGTVVNQPWLDIDPRNDVVTVEGKPIERSADRVYLLLHKPAGVITTVSDPQGRKTVLSLLGNAFPDRRLYPVGRLDADTTGALLLTDDGELAYRLTHPKYEMVKEYAVHLDRTFNEDDVNQLESGVMLEDGWARPDSVEQKISGRIVVTLHEGRKRIIKRMFSELGFKVVELHRVKFAGLSADDLSAGAWRELDLEEINDLRSSVGLEPIA